MEFFKTYSLLVLLAARKDSQEHVHQEGTIMPDAAASGKYMRGYNDVSGHYATAAETDGT